jgi:formate hydrogenlyase subunit 3/multisubunit Na+/H+ antiporter MnhD subunit
MNGFHSLSLIVVIAAPFSLLLLWPLKRLHPLAVRLTPWMALPALAASLLTPVGTTVDLNWLVLGTRLGLDATGQTLLFLAALVWGLGGWFSRTDFAADPDGHRFFGFFLPAMTGNFGVLLAFDAPSFYAFFALMSFSAYGLVIHRRDAAARRAARVYLSLVVLGEVLLFAAFVLIAAETNALNLPVRAGAAISPAALGLALFGFGIKAGLLPLHFGLPLAYTAAPAPAGAVLAGAMINAGLIGWLRVLPLGQAAPQPGWGTLLIGLGLVAAFFGVLAGITQRNPKTLLAYSSVSQMGLITIGVGAGLLSPGHWGVLQTAVLLYALHHGLAKGSLFLGLGVAAAAGAAARPWVALGLALPALALAGAPLTSGALAKTALKAATSLLPAPWPEWLALLLPLAAIGTTVLMARFLILAWPRGAADKPPAAGLWLPWAILVAAVGVTLFVWPAAGEFRRVALSLPGAWLAAWPVLAGALLSLAAWTWGRRLAALPPLPAGDLLIPIEGIAARLDRRRPGRAAATALSALVAVVQRHLARLTGRIETSTLPVRFERHLQRWPVVGTVFMLLGAVVAALLLTAQR